MDHDAKGDMEALVEPEPTDGIASHSPESPLSGKGVRILLWFCLGCLIGSIFTQLPFADSPFSKELKKESEFLPQFMVNDRELSPKAAGTSQRAVNLQKAVTFVTLQTKGDSLLEKVGGPFEVVNIGEGRPWHGYKTKFKLLLPFLKSKNDDDLVAFMDGTDIFWGGCEMSDFLHYYQQIVEASGASIVISAEIACGEQARDCSAVPTVPAWANHLANQSLNTGFWQKYVSPKGCGGDGCPCHEPPQVMFLNSGFIMGTVKALKPVIAWCLYNYDAISTLGDQSVLAQYWITHPHEIALDYQGELCLSTSDLNPHALFGKDPKTGGLWNKAFGRMQCLLHGNGRGRYALWDLLGRFSVGKHGERYAKALNFKRV